VGETTFGQINAGNDITYECPQPTPMLLILRSLAIDRPNQVWCADITYIPMATGFVYLVAVMDWFSRRVLAWRLSTGMDKAFCVETLQEALGRYGSPTIFNTDQGVHQRQVHRRSDGQRCPHQHGWQRPLPGHHLYRTVVA
jgi:transposase InsO family protein